MSQRTLRRRRLSNVGRLFALLAVMGVLAQGEEAADHLVRGLQDRYNGAKTLSVRFEENYSVLGHARPPESGLLTLRKQGKMRWEYSRPEGKLLISDGKTIFLYTAKDNRVEKIPVKDTEDMRAPLGFLLGHLDLKKEFRNFSTRPENGDVWLGASAKNDRVPYESIAMLVRPDMSVRRMKIEGRDGSTMTFAFGDERINPPADDRMFHFEIPAGAQVADTVEFGSEGK